MTKLTDAQLLDEAVKCLEHALQSTAIRDCQCAHCLGFMQEAPLLLAAIKGRSALETSPARLFEKPVTDRLGVIKMDTPPEQTDEKGRPMTYWGGKEAKVSCIHTWTVLGAPRDPYPEAICEGGCGRTYAAVTAENRGV